MRSPERPKRSIQEITKDIMNYIKDDLPPPKPKKKYSTKRSRGEIIDPPKRAGNWAHRTKENGQWRGESFVNREMRKIIRNRLKPKKRLCFDEKDREYDPIPLVGRGVPMNHTPAELERLNRVLEECKPVYAPPGYNPYGKHPKPKAPKPEILQDVNRHVSSKRLRKVFRAGGQKGSFAIVIPVDFARQLSLHIGEYLMMILARDINDKPILKVRRLKKSERSDIDQYFSKNRGQYKRRGTLVQD